MLQTAFRLPVGLRDYVTCFFLGGVHRALWSEAGGQQMLRMVQAHDRFASTKLALTARAHTLEVRPQQIFAP